MIILNLLPFNLTSRILFDSSYTFSIIYFIFACCEIIHIIYNHFYPSSDWQARGDYKRSHKNKLYFHGRLFIFTIINFVIILFTVLIMPIFHI